MTSKAVLKNRKKTKNADRGIRSNLERNNLSERPKGSYALNLAFKKRKTKKRRKSG